VLYILMRVSSFCLMQVGKKSKVVCALLASFLRVLLILTFYVYDSTKEDIINGIH